MFAEDVAVQPAKALEPVQVGVTTLDDDELLQIGVAEILLLKDPDGVSVLLAVIVGILPFVVFTPENVLLTADGALLLVVLNHPENIAVAEAVGTLLFVEFNPEDALLAEADGILLLVVFNHPENVLLAGVVGTLLLVVFNPPGDVALAEAVGTLLLVIFSHPENVLLAGVVGTLLLVVFSHPEKVLLTGAVGTALFVVLKTPEDVPLVGLADGVVSTEELVTVMDNEEFIVLLVPGPSELVGKLLITTAELSEVIDGPLGELTGIEALVGSADGAEDISVLGKDVAGFDNELSVPLELEAISLDTLLASEDWTVFADVEPLSDEDGRATGHEVPVVFIVKQAEE
ncbi:GREB1 domain containing protein [Pyrenophora tritici-repentis]|uniref:Herpes-BLLF1 multi-domain protein n=2 Tax=Pyrenophora tritici-repentis TaxID=45151 RepID=A0A2W1GSQ6_9PLEO|nr:uncharacterized protein PTRG_02648 [Pyrenophora tritici-repentis Pt-1C-BFP]KAA8623287.1 GREB1 domain-containing protein [Pyrenophora tritici-repentis]EDU45171.1 predicted protein [Pyrenophora tritici-repentis Pt-1C-BFP]KAF7452285.1 GREB1 domain containing protein [Pyrenophora tritici-repentis]KAF7574593.1 Herpes-BLLF1 multi-domain protein [Pyrenophora tritici-repentis]KAG9386626.1 GREB1 domain containing protein [Pyrenophora tritici-repentis]